MTKGEILDRFADINHAYNNSTRYDTLSNSIDEMLDSIRAEIDSHCSDNRDRNDGLYIAMKIIDRYKG